MIITNNNKFQTLVADKSLFTLSLPVFITLCVRDFVNSSSVQPSKTATSCITGKEKVKCINLTLLDEQRVLNVVIFVFTSYLGISRYIIYF